MTSQERNKFRARRSKHSQSLKHSFKWSLYLMRSSHTSAHLQKKSTCFLFWISPHSHSSQMPFARLHSQMVCTQSEPAEIPQHMFVRILVQVGGDRKWRTSRTTLRTPTPLVIRHCFLVYCARTWKFSFPPYLEMSETQMNSCMGTCVALSIFCLNIALLCSPLNAFETWADQQELSKEAIFFFWWGLLHGPQQGPDRMKEKT